MPLHPAAAKVLDLTQVVAGKAVHLSHVASGKKYVTYLGLLVGGVGTVMAALALDTWARTRWPWLAAAGIAGTAIGGVLATFGRGIADRRPVQRAEQARHTAEHEAAAPGAGT